MTRIRSVEVAVEKEEKPQVTALPKVSARTAFFASPKANIWIPAAAFSARKLRLFSSCTCVISADGEVSGPIVIFGKKKR